MTLLAEYRTARKDEDAAPSQPWASNSGLRRTWPRCIRRSCWQQLLGREIDLIDYGGLKPKLDDDIQREAVLLW